MYFPFLQANLNISPRSYDSEDENMGRNRGFNQYSKAPIYSKGDIIEQVITMKQ
jgi:hypothetical protein